MNPKLIALSLILKRLISSKYFFYTLVFLFTLSALWVATSSLYPMAFDEDFHMGLIQIYATSWIPYGIEQANDMAVYGPATADASYLFHYFMSFPYRILTSLGVPFDAVVVVLRLLNISLVVAALFVFRRALIETKISKAIIHVCLAIYMLIPVFPMLAGQVNYDNLLLLIFAFCFLAITRITRSLLSDSRLPVLTSWLLIIALLFGMPTKYAFVPLAAGLVSWIIVLIYRASSKVSVKQQFRNFYSGTQRLSLKLKVLVVSGLVIGTFFSAHYVTNFVEYGTPIPACDKVFDEQACLAYGPWGRNNFLVNNLSESFAPLSLPGYLAYYWLPDMIQRLTFAVAGPTNLHETREPLPVARTLLVMLTMLGIVSICLAMNSSLRRVPIVWLTLLLSFIYLAPLTWKLYQSYVTTGEPVAINGRYLLPLLPLIGVSLALGIRDTLRRTIFVKLLPIFAAVVLVLLLIGGGGIATYVVQAESHWFWPGWGQASHTVLDNLFRLFTIRWI